MTEEWTYGTILRRAVTKNPLQFQYVMFIGPAKGLYSTRHTCFEGVLLSELPPPAVGEWVTEPRPGDLRKRLRRDLFERAEEFNDK